MFCVRLLFNERFFVRSERCCIFRIILKKYINLCQYALKVDKNIKCKINILLQTYTQHTTQNTRRIN